jgi:hypothetical protein
VVDVRSLNVSTGEVAMTEGVPHEADKPMVSAGRGNLSTFYGWLSALGVPLLREDMANE